MSKMAEQVETSQRKKIVYGEQPELAELEYEQSRKNITREGNSTIIYGTTLKKFMKNFKMELFKFVKGNS